MPCGSFPQSWEPARSNPFALGKLMQTLPGLLAIEAHDNAPCRFSSNRDIKIYLAQWHPTGNWVRWFSSPSPNSQSQTAGVELHRFTMIYHLHPFTNPFGGSQPWNHHVQSSYHRPPWISTSPDPNLAPCWWSWGPSHLHLLPLWQERPAPRGRHTWTVVFWGSARNGR